jgi:UDP-N-acetylmuramate dehydrogenase
VTGASVGAGWDAVAADIAQSTGVRPSRDEQLALHTTMRVGGPADLFAIAHDIDRLAALVRFARRVDIPYVVVGRGSNLVVGDAGIRGLVILSQAQACRVEGDRVFAESGALLARAATLAQRVGLSGLEFGLAIPGTVGGAVWANAGAHGSDISSVLETVRVLGTDGRETDLPAAALGLAYRESRFKHPAALEFAQAAGTPAAATSAAPSPHPSRSPSTAPAPEVVLEATFRLVRADPAVIKARLDDIRRWRREHQPLNLPSAGSVFRNPVGDSAGRLIDAANLKGTRVGGASISAKHANFIVNDGEATAADVRRLAETVRAEVARRFGVELAYEVQFLGDWTGWNQEGR